MALISLDTGHCVILNFANKKKSTFNPDVKGIILCDGILDWVRHWYEGQKGIRDNFAGSAVFGY